MRIVLTVYRGRISPLLDTARVALLVEIDDGIEVSRTRLSLAADRTFDRIDTIVATGAHMLVCGAVSDATARYLVSRDIRVWSGVAGPLEDVIASVAANGMIGNALRIPGWSP